MSDALVSRLRGIYGVGPDGELGYRTFFVPLIQLEAAAEIERLNAKVERLTARGIEDMQAEIERLKTPRRLTVLELCELLDTTVPEDITDERSMEAFIQKLYPQLIKLYSTGGK